MRVKDWWCANCRLPVDINARARCVNCNSDALTWCMPEEPPDGFEDELFEAQREQRREHDAET